MGGGLGENGYMCVYDWVPSLFTWNDHSVINRPYPKTKWKVQKQQESWAWYAAMRVSYNVAVHTNIEKQCPCLCCRVKASERRCHVRWPPGRWGGWAPSTRREEAAWCFMVVLLALGGLRTYPTYPNLWQIVAAYTCMLVLEHPNLLETNTDRSQKKVNRSEKLKDPKGRWDQAGWERMWNAEKYTALGDSNITVRNTVEFGLEKCKGFIWGK